MTGTDLREARRAYRAAHPYDGLPFDVALHRLAADEDVVSHRDDLHDEGLDSVAW